MFFLSHTNRGDDLIGKSVNAASPYSITQYRAKRAFLPFFGGALPDQPKNIAPPEYSGGAFDKTALLFR